MATFFWWRRCCRYSCCLNLPGDGNDDDDDDDDDDDCGHSDGLSQNSPEKQTTKLRQSPSQKTRDRDLETNNFLSRGMLGNDKMEKTSVGKNFDTCKQRSHTQRIST